MGFNNLWLPHPSYFEHPDVALHASLCSNDASHMRKRLANASPHTLNYLNDKWGSPLHVAIRYDNIDAVDLLLRAGADAVTPRDFPGMGYDPPAPLLLAIGLGRKAIVQRVWRHTPPDTHANGGTRPYWSCVAHAARCGQADILAWLLDAWNRWSQEALGYALQAAARRLDFFCVNLLLPRTDFPLAVLNEALRGAAVDTEYEDVKRSRELCTAAECLSQERVICALIQEGADPNALSNDGEPLVTEAARFTERTVALRALLEGGADPNAARKNGSTALHLLAAPVYTKKILLTTRKHHEDGIRLLLAYGACMYTKAARGELPLHRAAFYGTMPIFQLYLSALAPADRSSAVLLQLINGESLLHWAAAGGQYDILAHLLSLDNSAAYINDTTDNGWTPLLCALVPQTSAAKGAHEAMQAARLLLAHGADPRLSTAEGWTPLHGLALHRDRDPAGETYVLAGDLIAGGVDVEARAALPDATHLPWGHAAQAAVTSPRCKTGMTPLLWAADRGALGVSTALVEGGAALSCTDDAGRGAVQVAWESRHLQDEDDM